MTKFVGNSITFPKLSAAPSTPVSGDTYYDTTFNKPFTYNGTEWVDLTLTSATTGATGYWGSFWSTQDQSAANTTTAYPITFNNTDGDSSGVAIVSNSRVTFSYSGVYDIQFSAQADRVSGFGADTIDIWFRKNGTDVPDSNTVVTVSGSANAAKTVAAWNYVVSVDASDYVELVWRASDTNLQLIADSAGTSPTRPAVPSVILTATQVMNTQVGPQGPTGPTGPAATPTAMNYAQTQATKQSSVSASGVTIVSASLTTNGYPVQLLVTGDAENSALGGWIKLQLFRDSTAIGKQVHVESSAVSENIPYSLTVIDTPAAGTYTYALKTASAAAAGTFNFGETDGPVLTAIELTGGVGPTGATGAAGVVQNISAGAGITVSGSTAYPTVSLEASLGTSSSGTPGISFVKSITADVYGRVTFYESGSVQNSSTTAAGVVQLSDSISTTSSTLAATPTAVKSAYDIADGKVSKSGDTITGKLAVSSTADDAMTVAGAIKLATAGSDNAIYVGDDSIIFDADAADTMGIKGQQTATNGAIVFGSGKDTNIYRGGANILKTDDALSIAGHVLGQYDKQGSADNTTITTAGTYYALTGAEVSFTPNYVGQRWLLAYTGYASLNTTTIQYCFVRANITDSSNTVLDTLGFGRADNFGQSGRGATVAVTKVWVADTTSARKFKLYGTAQTTNGLTLSLSYTQMTAIPIG
jgi:hypothetical protein